MSIPCITSFGMMRNVQGLPGSVILIEDALGRLGRRQRTAGGVFVLHLELEAVDAGLVQRLERELDPLLVLRAEIGSGTRHRQQRPDLDGLVGRKARRHDGGRNDGGERQDGKRWTEWLRAHGSLLRGGGGPPIHSKKPALGNWREPASAAG